MHGYTDSKTLSWEPMAGDQEVQKRKLGIGLACDQPGVDARAVALRLVSGHTSEAVPMDVVETAALPQTIFIGTEARMRKEVDFVWRYDLVNVSQRLVTNGLPSHGERRTDLGCFLLRKMQAEPGKVTDFSVIQCVLKLEFSRTIVGGMSYES